MQPDIRTVEDLRALARRAPELSEDIRRAFAIVTAPQNIAVLPEAVPLIECPEGELADLLRRQCQDPACRSIRTRLRTPQGVGRVRLECMACGAQWRTDDPRDPKTIKKRNRVVRLTHNNLSNVTTEV